MSVIGEINVAAAWVVGNDTGISSKIIWSVMMGVRPEVWIGIPHNADDFGRCHRLLKLIPSWRARLPEVAKVFPEWAPIIDIWIDLEAWYEVGEFDKVYDAIQKLTPHTARCVRMRR